VKIIEIGKGHRVRIDDGESDHMDKAWYCVDRGGPTARRSMTLAEVKANGGVRRTVYLAHDLLGVDPDDATVEVVFRDGDTLNCQHENLEVISIRAACIAQRDRRQLEGAQ
jgi:endonuclease YncB( thermonuclease family)